MNHLLLPSDVLKAIVESPSERVGSSPEVLLLSLDASVSIALIRLGPLALTALWLPLSGPRLVLVTGLRRAEVSMYVVVAPAEG